MSDIDRWSDRLITAPESEPISVNEAKLHVRLDGDDENAIVYGLIVASRASAEKFLGRALMTQTRELTLDDFPDDDNCPIRLPAPPVQSVTSVKYYDENGTLQTWAGANYQTDLVSEIPRLMPVFGGTWPVTKYGSFNTVQVRYVAGYGVNGGAVPEPIRQAILLTIGELFENRSGFVVGSGVAELPHTAQALLMPYRAWY